MDEEKIERMIAHAVNVERRRIADALSHIRMQFSYEKVAIGTVSSRTAVFELDCSIKSAMLWYLLPFRARHHGIPGYKRFHACYRIGTMEGVNR